MRPAARRRPRGGRPAARARVEAAAELGAKDLPWLEGTLRQMRQRALEDATVSADADFGATLTDLARWLGDAAYAHAALAQKS